MSDSIHISRKSLTFAANTAKYASKYGLKKGAQKAASKANPALMVIEAGISVANAVHKYLQVREAKAERDGLKELIPKIEKRLETERRELDEMSKMLREKLKLKKEKQSEISEFVVLTVQFYTDAVSEVNKLRSNDIVDTKLLDQHEKEMEKQWRIFQRALKNYIEIIN